MSVYESAQRIVADDGTWTKGDALACARFSIGAIEEVRARVAEAGEALAQGDEAVVAYLRRDDPRLSYADVAEEAERETREKGYRFGS